MDVCSEITGLEPAREGWHIHTNHGEVRLCFLTNEILRLRVSFDKVFAEESYVLAATAWEDRMDGLFGAERTRFTPVLPQTRETAETLVFLTEKLRLELDKRPFCIRLYDHTGTELYRSLAGCPFTLDRNGRVTHYSRMKEDDCFYGFGETGGPLNKNKQRIRERATDAMGYDPACTDALYKHIPFYIRLDRETRQAVGLFYHNFYESEFDLGRDKSNYLPRYSYFRADGGEIDLFLLGGGSLRRILDNYTLLTGRPILLPKRALGYQGSSMYYAELEENSDRAILGFTDTLRGEGFPLDGFHLSSGYTNQDGKRCVFTWDKTRFPAPGNFFTAMAEKGAPVTANVKPGVLLTHPRFAEWEEAGVFLRDSKDPARPAIAPWWGGPGVYWDFTAPIARQIWRECLKDALPELGSTGVWNDNCEYDGLMDLDTKADFDNKGGTLAGLKPLMATLMCREAILAIEAQQPGRRPYVVCRSGSAGIQRYAQTWCGDNRTGWDSLKYNIPTILGMGLSGQPNEGADVGGFAGPAPERELFLRWVQNGIFQPRFSIHSANNDNTVTEPWMYPDAVPLIREAMLLRYRLLPYFYSAMYEATQTGAPILRPLVYEFQDDPGTWDESFVFLLGRDLLVANVLEPGAASRRVYLPAGCEWYDLNDNFRPYKGGQTVEVPVTLATIPMFLREGAVIPTAGNQLMNMERDRVTDLRLTVAPGTDRVFTLYDDDGVTKGYLSGEFRKTEISLSCGSTVTLSFRGHGSYADFVERVAVDLICPEKGPCRVYLDGEALPRFLHRPGFDRADRGWYFDLSHRAVRIKYPNPRRDAALSVCFEDVDLIGM